MLMPVQRMARTSQRGFARAERIADPAGVIQLWRDNGVIAAGCFQLEECSVILAHEPLGPAGEYRWHLSIAHPYRYPTWDEIAEARYQLLDDNLLMVMVLPPSDQYVNAHPNCFHLHECPEAQEITQRR